MPKKTWNKDALEIVVEAHREDVKDIQKRLHEELCMDYTEEQITNVISIYHLNLLSGYEYEDYSYEVRLYDEDDLLVKRTTHDKYPYAQKSITINLKAHQDWLAVLVDKQTGIGITFVWSKEKECIEFDYADKYKGEEYEGK